MTGGIKLKRAWKAVACVLLMWSLWGCDYARMKEQESVNPYEAEMPEMPAGSIPVDGGLQALKATKPTDLRNPVPFTKKTALQGRESYGYFCVMCHGPKGDGRGTVGQSFYPLPTDLTGSYVQDQTDGELFHSTTFGANRMAALGSTVSEKDRWMIIHYIRSLVKGPLTPPKGGG